MQRVKLIFANQERSENDKGQVEKKLRVSIKNDWVFQLDKEPEFTIGYTLQKYKIASTPQEEKEMAKKYRTYRVREDPQTRYRYVTEIINMEEAKQLVNKKWVQILICHKSMIKNPQEDFKNILDEAERKMLKDMDENEENKEQSNSQAESENHSSESSSSNSNNGEKTNSQKRVRTKNMGQKRTQMNKTPGQSFMNNDETAEFSQNYPQLEIAGKSSEYYKVSPCLEFIRETSGTEFKTMKDFEKQMIQKLNKIHHGITQKGNTKLGTGDFDEFYKTVITPKYVCIKCKVHRKCRFAVWFSMQLSKDAEPVPEKIKYCRTINNNHDIEYHKEENVF